MRIHTFEDVTDFFAVPPFLQPQAQFLYSLAFNFFVHNLQLRMQNDCNLALVLIIYHDDLA